MTAVLAAAGRVAIYGTLVLAVVVSILWTALSPPGFATMAWLAVTYVTIAGCGVAWEWLGKRRRGGESRG